MILHEKGDPRYKILVIYLGYAGTIIVFKIGSMTSQRSSRKSRRKGSDPLIAYGSCSSAYEFSEG